MSGNKIHDDLRYGKQKRVRRPQEIDALPVDEFIRNADPIWLHLNGMWDLMNPDDED